MNTTTGRTRFVLVLAPLVLAVLGAISSALACGVGTGTSASCTEAALSACLPGGGSFDGTVTFNCGGAATITVTSSKAISADTTIDGGSVITISGGNTVGVFSVNSGVTFTVENLTIVNGRTFAGGAINNNFGGATLIVTNCAFSGNRADSGLGGLGGGAISTGRGSVLTVTNSTFSGNHAFGGGLSFGGHGGAILNFGTLTVTNSTFSGNGASGASSPSTGGAISNAGTATVTNTTFLGNGAGTFGGGAIFGEATVTNSILANSTSGGNCSNAITDGGHNIDDGSTCGFTGASCATTTGTSFCNTNALLDPAGLASNGGPTQTIALEAGSPAINAGDETVCAAPPVNNLDQRGFVRPGAGATNCSVGAYEFNATTSTTTTTTSTTTLTTSSTTTTHVPTTTTTSTTTSTTTTTHPPTTTTTTTSSSTNTSTTTTTQPPTTTTTAPPTTTTTTSTTTTTQQPTTSTTTTTKPPTTTAAPPTTTTTAPPTVQCPLGEGYWTTHPAQWPVSSLTLGSQTYTQAELLALLTKPVRGDASLILADQLIAAKVNIANGSDPTPITSTVADADSLLSGFAGKLPYQHRPNSAAGQAMIHDASALAQYNGGALTPTCSTVAVDDSPDAQRHAIAAQIQAMETACAGGPVPLRRRLQRAQRLFLIASGRTGGTRADVLRRVTKQLQRAAQIAARSANGKLPRECSGALGGL